MIIARQLIAADLRNHATLAHAYPARKYDIKLAQGLRELSTWAEQAVDLSELLGLKGAGAAACYGELSRRIDPRLQFELRLHPFASDPVNIMLNVKYQTVKHLQRIVPKSIILHPAITLN